LATRQWAFRFLHSKILNKNTSTLEGVTSGRSEELHNVLDSLVGLVVGDFEFAVGAVCGIRSVVETAVGERTAKALVEEQEQEGDLHSLGGEAVGVAGAISLQQSMSFQLAESVAELVQSVGVG
jgi:hypothetical protein